MSMVAIGLTAVSVGSSLYSGVAANKSAKKQASLMEQQGALQRDEALREASRIRDEGYRFKQEQMMQFIGSGVEVQGTPLLVLAETTSMAEAEARATEKRGYAESDLANANAKITRSMGKAQMIASIGSAVGSGVSSYKSAGGK